LVERRGVIFAPSADITYPGREIWHSDQLFPQPGEISHFGFVHLPQAAFAAGYHRLGLVVFSQVALKLV